MKKKFGILFLVVLVLNCLIMSLSAEAESAGKSDGDLFSLYFVCQDRDIDISGIEIRVYSSVVSYEDVGSGYAEYSESYAFSVFSDSKGAVTFTRPSDSLSISINVDTVPIGYGVDSNTRFFFPSVNTYHISLAKIGSVGIEYENEEVLPVLRGFDGNRLYASARIQTAEIEIKSVDEEHKNLKYEKKYLINVQGIEYPYSEEGICTYTNDYEKDKYLYQMGLISQYELICRISKYILFPEEVDDACQMDGTEVYWMIRNYLESFESLQQDCSIIQTAFQKMNSEPTRSSAYVTSSSGHFRVYYNTTEVTEAVANAVAAVFDSVDAKFYTAWGFRRPYFDENTTYYKVFIVDTQLYNGQTILNGTEGSYINISKTAATRISNNSGYSGYPYAYYGVVAHEYMHAIFFRYGIRYNTPERKWMHESFAHWAGMAFKADFAAYVKNMVDQFMATPHNTLTYYDESDSNLKWRHYGACVFPLYIQQQQGGYNTIKKILSCYTDQNSNPINAIKYGLSYYMYNLAGAFAGCATYNVSPNYFYSGIPACNTWNSVNTYFITSYPYSPSVSQAIDKLACHYSKFIAPGNDGKTLTITVDYSYVPIGGVNILKTVREASNGTKYISNCSISNNRCTIVQNNFGNTNAVSLTIIPINAGTVTGMIAYTKTATLQ